MTFPQPEKYKDAPGVKRGKHTKLYRHETEYGTDVIWYHPKGTEASSEACYEEILGMGVLYLNAKFFTVGAPPSEEELETIFSGRSIICGRCGFHIWLHAKQHAPQIMSNALSFVRRRREEKKIYGEYEI